MSGQVDEAGREFDIIEAISHWRARAVAAEGQVAERDATWRARYRRALVWVDRIDRRSKRAEETTRDTVNHLYATIDRAVDAEAERDRPASPNGETP